MTYIVLVETLSPTLSLPEELFFNCQKDATNIEHIRQRQKYRYAVQYKIQYNIK